ncbi:unnamed protein product [Arabidopsis arenosa]|uniref:t-SNARE coiled-coil homology domain-containing protein n=1 Tax=Arabidopsis arenosa TaxID=38785 RepID=A0A8S1ZI17_ARAAE|nr:unnamed protein product [Arabidopsis arenosa]
MASSSDSWMREYNDALKLSEEINGMISERSSSAVTGPDAQRRASAIRRKITIFGTRLDSLQSLLAQIHGKPISEKEMNRRKDMVGNLRSKANQMANALNMSNFANRDSLLGPEIKPDDSMSRVTGMDNQGIVGYQRQVMREQDEGLEQLEGTVMSTKHIALAVSEELSLQTRLIDDLDYHVDVTDSRLRRVQKSLAVMNKNMRSGCSCMSMLLSVLGIRSMASSLDSWMGEHNEALKLSEEIDEMILERSSMAGTESYALPHASSMRRKITILATRVETLQYLVAKSPGKPISAKEMSRRKGMVEDLRSKANQMASALDMLKFSNIDSLLRPEKQDDIMSRVIGMDNQGIVGLQRQVMKGKLLDGLDHNVDVSASGVKKVQKRVDTGVCMSLLLSVLEVIGLADLIFSNPSDKVQEPRKV